MSAPTCLCDGGSFDEHVYFMAPGVAEWRPTGRRRVCLVCNGSGVSPRAREERAQPEQQP
jgi:hypothetical protein